MANLKKLLRQLFGAQQTRSNPIAARSRPTLECLEDRLVPATPTVLDLTTAGAQGTIGQALFQENSSAQTGCGVMQPFVRLEAKGAVEQGYNTDARPVQFDEKTSPTFDHAIQLQDIPVAVHGGVTYRELSLGINQLHSAPLLSLDELRLYVGRAGNLTGYNAHTHQLAGLDPAYDLDANGDHAVLLNASLSHGNGTGDVLVDIPDALLTKPGGNFIYLYSKFGATVAANGGFEEWSLQGASAPAASLSGFVSASQNSGAAYSALAGVTVTLTGVNDLGKTVTLTQTTDASGFYLFSGLRAGVYSITQTVPQGYQFDHETTGSAGGTATSSQFSSISLAANAIGQNYNFFDVMGTSVPVLGPVIPTIYA